MIKEKEGQKRRKESVTSKPWKHFFHMVVQANASESLRYISVISKTIRMKVLKKEEIYVNPYDRSSSFLQGK